MKRFLFTGLLLITAFSQASEQDIDWENGEEIHEVCATCHGEFSQGGKEGEYPRIAGMSAAYIEKQLVEFRTRKRPNMTMVEHTDEQELPDSDVRDIAAYVERIKLPTKLPPIDEATYDSYERLLLAEKTFNVARAPGDKAKGEKLYKKECRSCHGKEGWGRADKGAPFITGQFTRYLWRQVKLFLELNRIHDPESPDEELLADFSEEEIRDIFAYLSVVDD
ncbi:MAG: c-type cytochrome [Candidatus Sedimenticola sp. 4PFRAG1]